MAEWAYVDLAELEAPQVQGLRIVERDLSWRPTAARDCGLPGRYE